MTVQFRLIMSLLGVSVLLVGCEGKREIGTVRNVNGTLYGSNGKPIPGHARITLTPTVHEEEGITGQPASATIDKTGKFDLKTEAGQGVPEGKYIVTVIPYGSTKERYAVKSMIPSKYGNDENPQLDVVVDGDKTNWDVKLSR